MGPTQPGVEDDRNDLPTTYVRDNISRHCARFEGEFRNEVERLTVEQDNVSQQKVRFMEN
jgi:hypothetical protein